MPKAIIMNDTHIITMAIVTIGFEWIGADIGSIGNSVYINV